MKSRIIAVTLSAFMMLGVIAGCSPTTPTGGTTSAGAAADKTLKLRITASLPSLDWEHTTNTRDMKVWHQMFEGLYGMDEANNGYYKELAKEVKLSDDQKV